MAVPLTQLLWRFIREKRKRGGNRKTRRLKSIVDIDTTKSDKVTKLLSRYEKRPLSALGFKEC